MQSGPWWPLEAAGGEPAAGLHEPPRNQPVWPMTNLMQELASPWVVRLKDTALLGPNISHTSPSWWLMALEKGAD